MGCQGTGFLSHICREENRKNQVRKSANRLRIPLIRNHVLSASTLAAGAFASSSLLFLMRILSDSLQKLIRFFSLIYLNKCIYLSSHTTIFNYLLITENSVSKYVYS